MSILEDYQFNKPLPSAGKRVIYPIPKNPADKATIISIFPKRIIELKYTIFPGRFEIPAAINGEFELLVISSSSYYKASTIEKMPPTEIQVNSAALAQSIVDDYLSAIWLSSKGVRSPGIFWIPGAFNKKNIFDYIHSDGKTFQHMLDAAREGQKLWFLEMVNAADELWARSNGNPRAIPEDSRLAAEFLQVSHQKAWMSNTIASNLSNCPACGEMINLNYPVCKFCHAVIDADKAKELNLVFAKG